MSDLSQDPAVAEIALPEKANIVIRYNAGATISHLEAFILDYEPDMSARRREIWRSDLLRVLQEAAGHD